MKNKGILIAVVITVVVALIGVFVFLYIRDPEIITRSPSEIISGGTKEGQVEVPLTPIDSTVINPAGSCLVISESYCESAAILYNSEGAKLWGVGFPDVPVGTKLYSPIDGYLHLMSMSSKQDGSVTLIIISEDEDWVSPGKPGQRYFSFIAKGLDILTVDKIKKGEVFAEVRESAELGGGFYASKVVLIASPDPDWAKMIDNSVTDPKEYLITAIKELN